jgi:PAS domain S-box-containing protein
MTDAAGPAVRPPIALDRDRFMRQLIASLGHLNEGILGSTVTGAYIMNVGLSMGAAIEAEYKRAWGIDRPFTVDEYAHVIVDLKQRIQGDFSLVSAAPAKVVVRTTSCPFDEFVRQSPSLCFMTSSVFGGIAGCYVSVFLRRTPEAEASFGREYLPDVDQASPDIVEQLRLMQSIQTLRRRLSETAARWEELVETSAEAVLLLGPDGTITFANARWRDLLGVEGGELIGLPLARLARAGDEPAAAAAAAAALNGERVPARSLHLRRHDGGWCEAQLSLSPLRDEAGAVIGALVIARDVTEALAMQRLKDTLLTMASHELRTPLATIRGLTDVLLRTLDQRGAVDPAELTARLATIRRAADRLALLSADLVDVTRLQADRLTLRHEPVDLNALVAACVARQRDLLAARLDQAVSFALVVEGAAQPVRVRGDRARLEHVIDHLLENAVKYSPHGGEIAVRALVQGEHAVVSVADRGIGIAAADLGQLFTPFFRGSNSAIGQIGGLGLGLYLNRAIAEAHGGALIAHPRAGGGMIFTLSLPLEQGRS